MADYINRFRCSANSLRLQGVGVERLRMAFSLDFTDEGPSACAGVLDAKQNPPLPGLPESY